MPFAPLDCEPGDHKTSGMPMQILLVNDDGIHAPSLLAIHNELRRWGDVTVVSPATEQSGVGHSITYLHPLVVFKDYRNGEFFGW